MPLMRSAKPVVLCALLGSLLTACAKVEIAAPHMAPIPKEARMLLGRKAMTVQSPIFVRIFKAESELEVWKQRLDGHFYHFKTYPICNWSGGLGPKLRQGDKQSPEGFYRVNRHQMNPNSKFHLSFDLGYPNAFDKAHGRTGNFLMVHGKCRSAGCYAMTDALMEEIYALAREAFAGGQKAFHVHAFPFRMTEQNLARFQGDRNSHFWRSLKDGYDYFEVTRKVPSVVICRRRYHVNVEWNGPRPDPNGACPRFVRGPIEPFVAPPGSQPNRAYAPNPSAPTPVLQPAASPQHAAAGQPRPGRFNGRMSLAPRAMPRPPMSINDLLLRQPN